MSTFSVPTRNEVSAGNQAIFDKLTKQLGFVPNLYAAFAHSENALGNFLSASSAKTSLTAKEKEAVDLAVSEVNDCSYCLAAHTAIAKGHGLTEHQTLELREGRSTVSDRLDALAAFARQTALDRGKPSPEATDRLLAAGFTRENVVDAVLAIGNITVTNYLHGLTCVPVDFPAAPKAVAA